MTLTALLLAGGRSSRMGFDKATLNIGGEPLWQRQLRVLCELSPATLWISARARPAWCPSEVEVVLDESPLNAPLSGLARIAPVANLAPARAGDRFAANFGGAFAKAV